VLYSAGASVPLLAGAIASGGGGHGLQAPLITLFPFAFLAGHAFSYPSQTLSAIVGALLELPLYALVVRTGARVGYLRHAFWAVGIIHLAAIYVVARCTPW
jgi:hypothetical protein